MNDSYKQAHLKNEDLKQFIDELDLHKLETTYYENGISCFVRGTDPIDQTKCTTKIELEIRAGKLAGFHYINGNMQGPLPKKPEKTPRELFDDFMKTQSKISSDASEINFDFAVRS